MDNIKIVIDERDFNIKNGQATNILMNKFSDRYLSLKEFDNDGEKVTKVYLNEKLLMKDVFYLTRKMVIIEAKVRDYAKRYWASDKVKQSEKDIPIEIL